MQRRKFALMAAEHVRALGERIRLRREELGMTQDEVARKMQGSVDGQRISKWERGENRPRDESLEDLARVLNTTALILLAPEPSAPTPDLIAGPDALTERLDAISERLETLAKAVEKNASDIAAQNRLLARQSNILTRIERATAAERQATTDAQATAEELRGLLAALGVASQALVAGSPHTAEAPGQRAT